jgi:signal transduction histidine kinase/CheY-like chemotaxis protein
MSVLGKLSNVGVRRVAGEYLQSKVRICNQISIFLFFLGLVYVGASLIYFPTLALLPGGASLIAVVSLLLNAAGAHRGSRFLMGIGAITLDSLYHAYLVPAGEPFIVPLYLAAFSFGLYPWVLIDLREKWLLGATVLVCLVWLGGQRVANDFFETAVDNSAFRTGWMVPTTYFFALSIGVSVLYFLQRRNIAMERERNMAHGRLTALLRQEQSSRESAEQGKTLLEKQLLQAQKMEAVGRLAGGVAHDLNNLLSPIIGYSEMLQDELATQPEARAFADRVLEAGLRARDLVGQLLAFSRQQPLELRSIRVSELISKFLPLIRRTIREDIHITVDLPPDLPSVLVDPRRIEQILMNLSVNAQDAMPEGGTLAIATRAVMVDATSAEKPCECGPGRYVVISVADDGEGIHEGVLPNIFEPFFTTKGNMGTGLGLATVFGIAKQHGGDVTVHSEVGKGSIFRVYLPASEMEAPEKSPQPSLRPIDGSAVRETVLLVEDDEEVRTLVETMLHRLGYRTLAVSSGEAGLHVLAQHADPIHVLLTDIIMPKMNGKVLYLAATKIHPSLRCIYMSGYPDNVIAGFGEIERGPYFLQKPFGIDDLARKLREALAHAPAPSLGSRRES